MKRRDILKCGIGLALATRIQPGLAADTHLPYSRALYEESVASGKPFFAGFLRYVVRHLSPPGSYRECDNRQ